MTMMMIALQRQHSSYTSKAAILVSAHLRSFGKRVHKKERPIINRINRQELVYDLKQLENVEKMGLELLDNREMYIPKRPLNFDATGKLLIYHTDGLAGKRSFFRRALIPPSIVLYCGVRAIQKRSWWRILLWSIPSLFSARIMWNALNMMSFTVIKMELKDDGESLVLQTMLWEGTRRKTVVKIKDIAKHSSPQLLQAIMLESNNERESFHFKHVPIEINNATYLLAKDGFVDIEKEMRLAILNGFPIDVQKKTVLTDELARDRQAYQRESENSLVLLDI